MEFPANEVEKSRRSIGFGGSDGYYSQRYDKKFTGTGAMAAALIDKIQCDAGQMPTLWQVRGHWQGPMLDAAVSTIFQPQTDILSLGKALPNVAPGGISVTQGLTNGELQTASLICGVFVHVAGSPQCWTVPGAAFTKPTAAQASPVIPDTWTSQDTGNNGPLGLVTGQSLVRASMDYGNWALKGLWDMCRAFNFVWSYGDKTTLLDWPLRFMAWMPPNAQNGSSGEGPVRTITSIQGMNNYYTVTGNATSIFLPRNARRTGSVTSGGAQVSTFSPDDASREVVPTVGGISLREGLMHNTEKFMLPRPVLFPRGVALGMYLNQKDETAFNNMQANFSITNGLGLVANPNATVPPVYTPYANINPGFGAGQNGGVAPTFLEQTKDTPPVNNPLQVRSDEAIFKWGDLYIGIGAIGYELTQAQYDAVVASQGDISQALASAGCPCHIV
jgi:hypothetical protein